MLLGHVASVLAGAFGVTASASSVVAQASCLTPLSTHVVENSDRIKATFARCGQRLELVELASKSPEATHPIMFVNDGITASGAWKVVFRDRQSGFNPEQEVSASTPGLAILGPFVDPAGDVLVAYWQGTVPILGFGGVEIVVAVVWQAPDGSDYLEGAVAVSVVDKPADLYIARVEFPEVAVASIGPSTDPQHLVLPYLSGLLLTDPLGAPPFDRFPTGFSNIDVCGNRVPSPLPAFSVNVFALYNGDSGDLFYYGDGDLDKIYKHYRVDNADQRILFSASHFVPNVYSTSSYATPYFCRLGALRGDWMEAAEAYRSQMSAASWWPEPVGSEDNNMPSAMKNLVAQASLQPARSGGVREVQGDVQDALARDVASVRRVLGSDVYLPWYGGHAPDLFDQWYFLGYLPGRPSFAAGVREAQKSDGMIAAPYVSGSAATDYLEVGGAGTPEQVAIRAAAVRDEGGQIVEFGTASSPFAISMCNGANSWNTRYVDDIVAIQAHTECKAVYMDFYGGYICYSDSHNHAPGGGSYMYDGRMAQLDAIELQIGSEFGFSIEAPDSFLTDRVDLTNFSPTGYGVLAEDGVGGCSGRVGLDPTRTEVIPFFRVSHDHVKISNINGRLIVADIGATAHLAALEVLNFGQILSHLNNFEDLFESFADRGQGPYYRFLTLLGEFLRGPSLGGKGFLHYHNGTTVRPPKPMVTVPASFTGSVAVPVGVLPTFGNPVLAYGMYEAPVETGRDYAFAVANPWVGVTRETMEIGFVFEPSEYGVSGSYTVTEYEFDELGAVTVVTSPGVTGAFSPAPPRAVEPGHVLCWTFTAP
ncbi:MAG: DUF6259 domain-containing protein [Planctomycetota bacterium]